MKEPDTSNAAQQRQDKMTPKGIELEPVDPLGNRIVDVPSGAVHGGEETKPGQMQRDEDISPNAPQGEIESVLHRTIPPAD